MKKISFVIFVSVMLFIWGPGVEAKVTLSDLAVPPPQEFTGPQYAEVNASPSPGRGPASISSGSGEVRIQVYGACSRPGGVILQPGHPEYARCMENTEWQYGDYETSFKAVGIGIYLRP